MSNEITIPYFHDFEISKGSDFQAAADAPVTAIQGVFGNYFSDITNNVIVSGLTISAESTPSMNVSVSAGVGYDKTDEELIFLDSATLVALTAADASNDRIDTIEAKFYEEEVTYESRKFKDPSTGTESYSSIATRKKVYVVLSAVAGTAGSAVAPSAESGYIKIGEVHVPYGATTIINSYIYNADASYDGNTNTGWTADTAETFRLTSPNAVKKLVVDHIANTSPHSATSSAVASRLMIRDANGRAQVLAPSADNDIARKTDVDTASALKLSLSSLGTNWVTVLAEALSNAHVPSSTAALAIAASWNAVLAAALGTNWSTALAAALGSGWTTAMAQAVDTTPTANSTKMVTSGGVNTALSSVSVTALGTATVGSETLPFYLNEGSPAVCSSSACIGYVAGSGNGTPYTHGSVASTTTLNLYAAMSNSLPAINDWCLVTGYVSFDSVTLINVRYAKRISSSTINLYPCCIITGTNHGMSTMSIALPSSSMAAEVSFAW